MSDHDLDTPEQVDMRFRRPDSTVVSVRLNRDESRALTAAARDSGEKLSTYIKRAALGAAAARSVPFVQPHSDWIGGVTDCKVILGDGYERTVDAPPVRMAFR